MAITNLATVFPGKQESNEKLARMINDRILRPLGGLSGR
jgi:hypothetical protein